MLMQDQSSYRLSPMQEGILFQNLLRTAPGLYINQIVFHLLLETDIGCLEEAWRRVIQRHEVLRMSLHQEEGGNLQVVHSHVDFSIERHEKRHLAPEERPAGLHELLEFDRSRRFDMDKAPLWRLLLLQFSDEDSVLDLFPPSCNPGRTLSPHYFQRAFDCL